MKKLLTLLNNWFHRKDVLAMPMIASTKGMTIHEAMQRRDKAFIKAGYPLI